MIGQYLKDPNIRLAMYAVLGLGLAAVFRGTCKGDRCIVVRAPDPKDVEGKTFQYDGKCYQFQATTVSCPTPGV
jgi:hypothetical protein